MGNNGNNQTPQTDDGGTGVLPDGPLTFHGRADIALTERAVINSWPVDEKHAQSIVDFALACMMNTGPRGGKDKGKWGPRERLRGAALLTRIVEDKNRMMLDLLKQRYAEIAHREPQRHLHAFFGTAEQSRLSKIAESVGVTGLFLSPRREVNSDNGDKHE